MKIALVVTGGLHPSGTAQVIPALLWFIERMARAHDVHAFSLRHLARASTYRLLGATVHDLGRPRGRWQQWRALRRAVGASGPFDVIHGYWADPAGLMASLVGRRLSIASVVTCDSGEFVALPEIDYGLQCHFTGRAVLSLTCRSATRVHVASEYMQRLARASGVDAVRIPFGVDLQRVQPPAERREGPPWLLLQVASLNRVKDQSTLLQALATLRRSLDVRLDLVGEDTLDGRLAREADALGIADAVTFHGFQPQDALARLRDAAHLYVQSSRHEAAGVAVLEAAAAGLPVVGTRVGFVSDWADHAAAAVRPRDPEALAASIVSLIANPARRSELANAARARVQEHDADDTARRMTALYESLLRK
ncbi:MAG TPA: glycosyltransferase family 4 protein [Vicinamibacterales bacterium]|nr:glycosyltransferase family 4 protein [Vicinamibacterales bacterium]